MKAHIETIVTDYKSQGVYLRSKTVHKVTIGEATFTTDENLKALKYRLDSDVECTRRYTTKSV